MKTSPLLACLLVAVFACASGASDATPPADGGPTRAETGPPDAAPGKPDSAGADVGPPDSGGAVGQDAAGQDATAGQDAAQPADAAQPDVTPPVDTGPSCSAAGQIVCGGQCVDGQTDPTNCGGCGHACLGQACTAGSCAVVQLSTAFTALGGLTHDASLLYFTGADGTLRSVAKAGGPTQTIASGLGSPMGVAVDTAYAYVAVQGLNKIARVTLADGSEVDLATSQPQPEAVVVDDTNVYWTTYGSGAGNGTVMMCAKTGCTTPQTLYAQLQIPAAQQYGPSTGLAVDSMNLYFTSLDGGGQLHSYSLAAGTDQILASTYGLPAALALESGVLAVVSWGPSGRVFSAPTIPSAGTVLAAGQVYPLSAALTTSAVYWTVYNPGWDNGAQVLKCPLAGCLSSGPQILAQGVQPAEGIVVDSTYVYWLSNDGTVNKTPL